MGVGGGRIKKPVKALGPHGLKKIFRQRPTLPPGCPGSTIGAIELNFRVRDGDGCCLYAIATEKIGLSIWILALMLMLTILWLSRTAD